MNNSNARTGNGRPDYRAIMLRQMHDEQRAAASPTAPVETQTSTAKPWSEIMSALGYKPAKPATQGTVR